MFLKQLELAKFWQMFLEFVKQLKHFLADSLNGILLSIKSLSKKFSKKFTEEHFKNNFAISIRLKRIAQKKRFVPGFSTSFKGSFG